MEEEIWKDIKGYEGVYQVSNLGRVISLKRKDSLRRKVGGLFLKLTLDSKGYFHVRLSENAIVNTFQVHRLVITAFSPNSDNKPCINHKDGIKINNELTNLEWCTHLENEKHKDEVLNKRVKGEDITQSKLIEQEVLQIRASNLVPKNLASIFKVSKSAIYCILNYETWKHI